jgi:hypothetical protein
MAGGRGSASAGGRAGSSAAVTATVVESCVAADQGRIVRLKGEGLQLQIREEEEEEEEWAPSLKSGRLIDKLLYREKFMIRCYEVGTNRTASMETMANLLQVML